MMKMLSPTFVRQIPIFCPTNKVVKCSENLVINILDKNNNIKI